MATLPGLGGAGPAKNASHERLGKLLGPRRHRCFNFSHLPRVAPGEAHCAPRAEHSFQWWFDGPGPSCPTENYYMQASLLALRQCVGGHAEPNGSAGWHTHGRPRAHPEGGHCFPHRYAGLEEAVPCPRGLDLRETLVAHVRGGDIFTDAQNQDAMKFHRQYGQPPLEYYLGAWRASGLRRMLVLSEDSSNPVVRLLRLLQQRNATADGAPRADAALPGLLPGLEIRIGRSWATDLATLMCAEHLALAHSSVRLVLLLNRRLRNVYTPGRTGELLASGRAWSASCRTVFWEADAPRPAAWAATAEQKLELLLASRRTGRRGGRADGAWQASFSRVKRSDTEHPGCLGLASPRDE